MMRNLIFDVENTLVLGLFCGIGQIYLGHTL